MHLSCSVCCLRASSPPETDHPPSPTQSRLFSPGYPETGSKQETRNSVPKSGGWAGCQQCVPQETVPVSGGEEGEVEEVFGRKESGSEQGYDPLYRSEERTELLSYS